MCAPPAIKYPGRHCVHGSNAIVLYSYSLGGGGGGGGGGTERQKCQGHITSHANLNKSCRVFVKRARDN